RPGGNLVFVWSGNGPGDADGVFAQRVRTTSNAPVLFGTNDLTAINEDAFTNGGTPVSALVAGQVADADGDTVGIAVTAVNNTNGSWQFSTDGGTSWTAFGAPSAAAARLLAPDANTLVRFVPNPDSNGTVAGGLTFRAWDQTSGVAGGTADVTVNGGATAFSTATASASVTVNAVNDPPVNTVPAAQATAEDTPLVFSTA